MPRPFHLVGTAFSGLIQRAVDAAPASLGGIATAERESLVAWRMALAALAVFPVASVVCAVLVDRPVGSAVTPPKTLGLESTVAHGALPLWMQMGAIAVPSAFAVLAALAIAMAVVVFVRSKETAPSNSCDLSRRAIAVGIAGFLLATGCIWAVGFAIAFAQGST